MDSLGERCCVCEKALPNRFAVAGGCSEAGCTAPFCSLHWAHSNRLCPQHGYQETDPHACLQSKEEESSMESAERSEQDRPVSSPEKSKKAMKTALSLVKRLGGGAGELLRKLKKDRSPQAMVSTIDEDLGRIQSRREEVATRIESLHSGIVAKKREYAGAAKARQRIIEMELKSRLSEYKAAERELGLLLEKERVLTTVRGRINEIDAYGMSRLTEDTIDDITDSIEDHASDADGILSATRDLEKAGRRRESDSDTESLWEELDGFGDETPAAAGAVRDALSDFDEPEDVPGDEGETLKAEGA